MNWNKVCLNKCDLSGRIKKEKEKLIRYSDHEEDEDIISLLMDLEINQHDHNYNKETLERRIKDLEKVIEHLVDNYDIDLREVVKEFSKRSLGKGHDGTITDEMWLEATKQRRREERLGKLLD